MKLIFQIHAKLSETKVEERVRLFIIYVCGALTCTLLGSSTLEGAVARNKIVL